MKIFLTKKLVMDFFNYLFNVITLLSSIQFKYRSLGNREEFFYANPYNYFDEKFSRMLKKRYYLQILLFVIISYVNNTYKKKSIFHVQIAEKEEDPTIYPKFLMTLESKDESTVEGYFQFVKKAAKMVDVNVTKT